MIARIDSDIYINAGYRMFKEMHSTSPSDADIQAAIKLLRLQALEIERVEASKGSTAMGVGYHIFIGFRRAFNEHSKDYPLVTWQE